MIYICFGGVSCSLTWVVILKVNWNISITFTVNDSFVAYRFWTAIIHYSFILLLIVGRISWWGIWGLIDLLRRTVCIVLSRCIYRSLNRICLVILNIWDYWRCCINKFFFCYNNRLFLNNFIHIPKHIIFLPFILIER